MFKVSICGKANSGKNTLANLLFSKVLDQEDAKDSGGGWTAITHTGKFLAFADPIKEIILKMFPKSNREHLYGSSIYRNESVPETKEIGKPVTYRQLLIDLGSLGRNYDPNVWVNNFDYRFCQLEKYNSIVVCPDVRFRNEFDHLKKLNFYQIKLIRNSADKIDNITETAQDSISNDEFDSIIHNDGTLDDLEKEVKNIVFKLKSEI